MLIEKLEIGPGILYTFGRRRSFATDTDGTDLLGINGQGRFKSNVTLPLGLKVVTVAESLALMM